MNRKNFISKLPGIYFIPELMHGLNQQNIQVFENSDQLEDEEILWEKIRSHFYFDTTFTDLRTFAASPIPVETLEHFTKTFRQIQAFPSDRNHGIAEGNKETLRVKIAENLNCSYEEVAIMRSTTEALNNALMGINLSKGDEVLASSHEYDSMIASLVQREKREGIKVTIVDIPYQPESNKQVLELFKKKVTPRTRVILLSHIVWISGQIYPVEEICHWARENNILTVVDAAQSFSHIETDVTKIGCDYFGASLHKWCAAPVGTGFLYIRKENISNTYPLFASYQYSSDSVRIEKFENFGSSTPIFNSCVNSLDYWAKLGFDTKRQRILFLRNYLTDKLNDLKGVEIATNLDADQSCGIIYFTVKNKSAGELKKRLYEDYKISVQAIEKYKNLYVDYKGVNCVGVSTPVFILPEQLDYFVDSLKKLIS